MDPRPSVSFRILEPKGFELATQMIIFQNVIQEDMEFDTVINCSFVGGGRDDHQEIKPGFLLGYVICIMPATVRR